MHKKPATFLNLPEYPGGREQFKQFVKKHLIYPEEALHKRVEGTVILNANVTHKGNVENIKVEKGVGYGCDEEAVRILGLMRFGSVKNRGVRVRAGKKFKINFKLPPKPSVSYSFKAKSKNEPSAENKAANYSYNINLK